MFSSVAFDVVLGLIFIYLLYSLLATVLSEIIATMLALRALNLKVAIDRMLNDEKQASLGARIVDSMKLMKNPKSKIVEAFYNHPEIKYLGNSGLYRLPSGFKSKSFSKTLINLLFGNDALDSKVLNDEILEKRMKEILENSISKDKAEDKKAKKKVDKKAESEVPAINIILDRETAEYIYMLWLDAKGDLTAFRAQLEGWFDRTMDQASEWYKRKIQTVLLILGFLMAWFFFADTFVIVKNLSVDKEAREQLVSMANAYVESNPAPPANLQVNDSVVRVYSREKLDSLLEIKKQLDADIAKTNSILGIGGWLPDTVVVTTDSKQKMRVYTPQIDVKSLSRTDKMVSSGKIGFTFLEKLAYLFRLVYHHFFGFMVTAIAISLGAPFWFDLLNKLVKVRTSKKEDTDSSNKTTMSQSQAVTVKDEN
jgi:hypothetical protein